ncbi:MAG: hypothetical protein MAG551_01091 [Candidatus Scalindua arabica]|uniref:Uncharacterized protein n=1 Tax=Candidatus Scalindua arabica TaxID=1127984 RepID=A0A941W2J6_9BACT|nr:hypothetical protein [Candidatus Scalindua arabica]
MLLVICNSSIPSSPTGVVNVNQVPVNQLAVEFNKLSKDKKEEGPAK